MFEKIAVLVAGTPSLDSALPLLAELQFLTVHSGQNHLKLIDGQTGITCVLIELWGNKLILRGMDVEGNPRELVLTKGF